MTLFMDCYRNPFQSDGRTIDEIGAALGLNPIGIRQVQQDANRPDKVAMNVWRKICPTREHRLYVGSVKHVPETTLNDIYSKSNIYINK